MLGPLVNRHCGLFVGFGVNGRWLGPSRKTRGWWCIHGFIAAFSTTIWRTWHVEIYHWTVAENKIHAIGFWLYVLPFCEKSKCLKWYSENAKEIVFFLILVSRNWRMYLNYSEENSQMNVLHHQVLASQSNFKSHLHEHLLFPQESLDNYMGIAFIS